MRLRFLVTAVATLALSGCIRVHVPEDAYFISDARLAADGQVLPPGRPFPESARAIRIPYAGGEVAASYIPGRADGPLILFCGGNMFRQSAYGGLVGGQLAAFGDVLLFDYPGYGASTGASDIAGMKAAVAAMAAHARAIADREQRRLILWGHSLGGTVCAEGAVNAKADVLVLETTTPSANAVMQETLGWKRLLVRVRLAPPLAEVDIPSTLADYPGRIIVLEAGRDTVLPPVLSRRLAQALTAKGRSVDHLVFAEAGHNDVHSQPDFTSRMAEALARP